MRQRPGEGVRAWDSSAEQLGNASSDAANQVLDVIDISDDARQQLLQDQADAELLASIATSERPQVLTAPLILRNGRIEVDAIAAQIAQQFTFEESFELDFLQETSVTIETDEGSVEFTQSTALEVDFSSSISIEQNAETGSFQIAFDA